MKLSTNEIELFLRIYPYIKKSHIDLSICETNFSQFILESVDRWLEILHEDEKDIVKLRYFKQYTSEHIAGLYGYKSHSSVIKKCNKILEKIRIYFYR